MSLLHVSNPQGSTLGRLSSTYKTAYSVDT